MSDTEDMNPIEIKEGMSVEERLIVYVRQYDIRLGKDFCVNDPVDYQQTKGIIRGLNMAITEMEKDIPDTPENECNDCQGPMVFIGSCNYSHFHFCKSCNTIHEYSSSTGEHLQNWNRTPVY